MLRSRASLIVALVLATMGLTAGVAHAQDYPGTTIGTAAVPAGSTAGARAACDGVVSTTGPALPGGTVTLTGTCPLVTPGNTYGGTLQPTASALPVVVADGHSARYRVTLPRNFAVDAFHTAVITDASTGAVVFADRFYVDGRGRIAPAPTRTGSPRTLGAGQVGGLVKLVVILLAAAAASLLATRRLRLRPPTH